MIETLALGNFDRSQEVTEHCVALQLPGESRSALEVYTVFPGVTVMYNDFYTERCETNFIYANRTISIDHCQEGRIEWEHQNGVCCYVGEQDIQISAKADHTGTYGFPTGRYRGITINLQVEEAEEAFAQWKELFDLDLEGIYTRFCLGRDTFVLRSEVGIQHIFLELYRLQGQEKLPQLRLKVVELLQYLSSMDQAETTQVRPYYQKAVVEKVRAVKNEICRDLGAHHTLQELAAWQQLPETTLKRCFKSMYGDSVYAYLKKCRLRAGAELLRSSELDVMAIAMEVGYENPSKFIAAFKAQFGLTPMKYRQACAREERP